MPIQSTKIKLLLTCLIAGIILAISALFITNKFILLGVIMGVLCSLTFIINMIISPLSRLVAESKKYIANTPGLDEISQISQALTTLVNQLSNVTISSANDKKTISNQQTKLESIISSMTEGIVILNQENKIVIANSTAQKIFGYNMQEFQNMNWEDIIEIRNKDGATIPLTQICSPTDKPEIVTAQGKGTHQATIQISCNQINNISAPELKCILLIHDATSEKSMQGIQIDFVSMASHELRTPLTNIIGYLSVFMDENKTKLSKEQMEFLDRIMISAKQLGSLIQNLLNVSKVERNAFSITTRKLNWQQALTKSVEDNRLQAAQKNIVLSLKVDPQKPIPAIMADPIRITEVVNNLIGNAIDYTLAGGKIEVGAYPQGNEVITYVKDTGVGIPKEALAHLFTKFFRVQGALDTSSNSKGTGLGLYLSKSIIDLHHGRIWVESEVGKGTTFYFSLNTATNTATPSNLPPGLILPTQHPAII